MPIHQNARHWMRVYAVALGVAAGCSSGAQGSLVDCVVPGAACCPGGACAVGLACELGVCVAADAGGAQGAAPLADGGGEGAASVETDALAGGDTQGAAPADAPSVPDSSTCPAGSVCAMNAQGYMACLLSDASTPIYTCGGSGPQGPPMSCPEGWVCGYRGQGGYCYIPC